MNKPLLSICIATYNRANFIGETLESIIPQLSERVEVVIADGASTDNTGEIVSQYTRINTQIRYVPLGAKGGVDQDYCKAVEAANADMCWLFTDDDLLKPGAVERVLSEIEKGYSLIVVNAEIKNADLTTLVRNNELKIEEDKIFSASGLDGLFQLVMPYISFIGCVVIDRRLWLQRDRETYFGTEFIHVGVIFQYPLPTGALVMAEPYISIRWGNAQWTSRSFVIWVIKWPKLIDSFQYISKDSKKEYSTAPSFGWIDKILYHRAQGALSQKEYRMWLDFAKDSPGWWKLTVKMISLIPVPVVKLIIKGYGTVQKLKKFSEEDPSN